MAITDTSPTAPASDAAPAPPAGVTEPTGLIGLIGGADHKAIGRAYVVGSMLFGVASLLAGAVARVDDIVGDGSSLPLFAGTQLAIAFLFVIPMFVGLGISLTPLQVGSTTVAFPRAASLSFWVWAFGGVAMLASLGLDGGPGGSDADMVELWMLSQVAVLGALVLGAVCVATTVVALRTEGLSIDRVPMFSFGMLAAAGAWILTLPVLAGNVGIAVLNSRGAMAPFSEAGNEPWITLAWAVLLPSVYVCAIPLLGVVGDVVPTIAGVRQPYRGVVMFGIAAFAALSLGAWAQPAQDGAVWAEPLFLVANIGIILPVLACLGPWATALKRAGAKLASSSALIGLGGMVVLLLAAVVGALVSVEPLSLQEFALEGDGVPAAALGQGNLVLAAGIAGGLAAVWFWGAKVAGSSLPEPLGKLVGLLAVLGGVVWGTPLVIIGLQARFDGLADANDALSFVSAAGAALLLVASVAGVFSVLLATVGRGTPADPWGTGQTLEWATSSPPERGNFAALEPVRSPEPLLDTEEGS